MEQVAASGGRRTTYDARGLAEPVAEVPHVSEIDGTTAVFDAAKLTTRQINLELRNLIYEQGITDVTVKNPGAKHSIGVGILQRCRIRFEGSLGYFGVGLIDGPEITITGRVGWSVCENMMSGVVRIEKNGRSRTRAARRGAPRRRHRREWRGRRPDRDRPEGRHDHRRRVRRFEPRVHDAARPSDHPRGRGARRRRTDVRLR